jgi:SAM-dependent MidA family methyltransferase
MSIDDKNSGYDDTLPGKAKPVTAFVNLEIWSPLMQDQNLNLGDIQIAVILPCFNEEQTIVQVINEFQDALPKAAIHVFDNHSTDRTADLA